MRLEKGALLKSIYGVPIKILDIFGEGGQGIVYKVLYGNEVKALKMYKVGCLGYNPQAFYENIKSNIMKGSPSDMYLWPLDLVDWQSDKTFGYIMDVRPEGYYELGKFLSSEVSFRSFQVMIDGLLNLIQAFRVLHLKGMSYQDLNDGNFFFNPSNGNLKICDTDNVAPNGFNTGVIGKPRYIAPEIIRKQTMPSTRTDQYSLACILFMTLTNQHPLEGKRFLVSYLSPAHEEALYGYDPIFLMDPDNDKNRPVEGVHKNILYIWPELPGYIKDAFCKQFSHEVLVENSNKRFSERNWLDLFLRLRSNVIHCYHCNEDNFTEEVSGIHCNNCSYPIEMGAYFEMENCNYKFPVAKGNILYRTQLGPCPVEHALDKIMLIAQSNKNKKQLGGVNVSGTDMELETPSGNRMVIKNKCVFPIVKGCIVHAFGEKIYIGGKING